MSRVAGIDPGTISIGVCGLAGGDLVLDRSIPTAAALADPSVVIGLLESIAPLDLVAGPSGYGLPLVSARDVTEANLRLAYLAAPGETGGIGGLRRLMLALAESAFPVVLTPGVVHLPSVPAHRKVNRVDMGTADKVCAAALAVRERARARGTREDEVSCILLELGGAFTAALAVHRGRIVDGFGGTSGPIGMRSAGALDGEVAFLAGSISKGTLFGGGVADVAGTPDAPAEALAQPATARGRLAWTAYVEGILKAVAALRVSIPDPCEIVLSGRLSRNPGVRDELSRSIARVIDAPVHTLAGFAASASQAAQGAALIADGLMGGESASLVEGLGIRGASGTVLDHLYAIDADAARRRLTLGGRTVERHE